MGLLSGVAKLGKTRAGLDSIQLGDTFAGLGKASRDTENVPKNEQEVPSTALSSPVEVNLTNTFDDQGLEHPNVIRASREAIPQAKGELTPVEEQAKQSLSVEGFDAYRAGKFKEQEDSANQYYIKQIGGEEQANKLRQEFNKRFGAGKEGDNENLSVIFQGDKLLDMYLPAVTKQMSKLAKATKLPESSLLLDGRLRMVVKSDAINAKLQHHATALRNNAQSIDDLKRADNMEDTAKKDVSGVALGLGSESPINLITDKSVSHEWFHQVDGYLNALNSGDIHITENGDVIHNPNGVSPTGFSLKVKEAQGIRKDTFKALTKLHSTLDKQVNKMLNRLPTDVRTKLGDYFADPTEHSARAFEKWVHTVKQEPSEKEYRQYSAMEYPTDKEMEVLSPIFEDLFDSLKTMDAPKGEHKVLYSAGGVPIGNVVVPKNNTDKEK